MSPVPHQGSWEELSHTPPSLYPSTLHPKLPNPEKTYKAFAWAEKGESWVHTHVLSWFIRQSGLSPSPPKEGSQPCSSGMLKILIQILGSSPK